MERIDKINIGIAAHITAAAPGGKRYDASLEAETRGAVSNGIWLCQNHAKEIDDDPNTHTVELLRAWKKHAEEDARAMLGRPIAEQSIEITVEATLQRAPDDSLTVVGTSNLPDGTKLMITLYPSSGNSTLGQSHSTTNDGMFAAVGFSNGGTPHPNAWFVVEVLAYFNDPWQQAQGVVAIAGKEGAFLKGAFAEAIDVEFPEAGKRVRARFACIAPPLRDAAPLQEEHLQRSIENVKTAYFTWGGDRSAKPVGEIVETLLQWPGLKPRGEWQARGLPDGSVLVSVPFWSGETPAIAEWRTIPSSGEVRYWNLNAKQLSFMAPTKRRTR